MGNNCWNRIIGKHFGTMWTGLYYTAQVAKRAHSFYTCINAINASFSCYWVHY